VKIDCRTCDMYRSEHCEDCLVTAVLHPPEDVAEIDDALEDCIETLSEAGLIPVLRFRPRDRRNGIPGGRSEFGSDAETEAG
jgi:hypothetical protein